MASASGAARRERGSLEASPLDEARDVSFDASDGFPLRGTLATGPGQGPLVLISAATGVPSGYYAKFARALVEAGAGAVLAYDYRGMPGSPKPPGWRGALRMKDWGLKDMPAALAALESHAPGRPVVGVGQSFGGQALGICGVADRFERYAMVAALSGYWRNMQNPLKVFLAMNALGLPVTTLAGRTLPFMGLGEAIPATIYRDWARWCRSPDYFMSDPGLPETDRFEAVTTPILAVRHPDDPWGTEKAVEALLGFYRNAPIERLALGPQDAGGEPVGHLGFFRSRFAETLWPPVIDWLLRGELRR
ncbi:alpha/beta fold hydrolase [Nitratireductor mangrovi]|uniref:Alpha/beta fold hydrolase n=1 Tax=Nitratireductor mangrovi TaxID=2599600 RepID=A0A5B8L200_9HYPH|nr:alpha/beta fold hydrolase [Nitratireductor mangrovi]